LKVKTPDPIRTITTRMRKREYTFVDIPDEPEKQPPIRPTLDELDTSNPLVRQAVGAARSWAQRKRDGDGNASLVLCGPVGTGKTHIAKAMLWSIAYVVDGQPVSPVGKFFQATDLMTAFTPSKNEFGLTETPLASSVIGVAPIVVLDDVGSEQSIPFIRGDYQAIERAMRYFRLVDYCNENEVSLVVTSNLAPSDLGLHMGRRAWDRLGEMAPRGYIVDLAGVSSWRQSRSGR